MRLFEVAAAVLLAGTGQAAAQTPIALPVAPPATLGFDSGRLERLRTMLAAYADQGAYPGAVLLVGRRGIVAYATAVGRYGEDDPRPVTDSTIYDLASLTKVIGLTTATMILVAEHRLDLDGRVVDYLPEFAGPGRERVRIRHLLTHTSGMKPWEPLYLEATSPQKALALVNASPLEAPPGSRYAYSDLGAIVLTEVVERVTNEPLDRFLERRVFQPLGMQQTRFRPPPEWRERIAPTERDPWRGRVLRGEVHDENAARLGGVSGHAGLFSSAPDLARFAIWILEAYHGRLPSGASLGLPAQLVREFTRRQPGPPGSTRALGWDTPSPKGSSAGSRLSPSSFGHTGFTGTSIWIDPERELFIILLTNRVHPTRANLAIRRIRGEVADSVVGALIEPKGLHRPSPAPSEAEP